jgi:RNA polymerase sigma-70 factor (ECF subfamily)
MASDHELLVRTHRGDSAAAREFWSLFAPTMLGYARAILRRHGGEQAASDAVQTVLCRLLQLDRAAIARVEDVTAFLIRSTRFEALNTIRSNDRARARDTDPGPRSPEMRIPGPSPSTDVAALLDILPEDDREILILKHAAGLTFDQIALALDQNRNTVASRYRRAADFLRSRADTLAPEAHHV